MKELFKFPTDELFQTDTEYLSLVLNAETNSFNTDEKKIKFGNLIKEGKEKVTEQYNKEKAEKYIEQIRGFQDDSMFWRSVPKSIAFFITESEAYYYRLSVSTNKNVVFANKPYVLPLVENFQYVSYYNLLCLSHDKFRLFNGRGKDVQEINLPDDAPTDHDKALGTELTGGEVNQGPYGRGGALVQHGHNEKSSEVETDQMNYFRIVDEYVQENFTSKNKLPLVLFALPKNISDFENISKNSKLDETKIEESPARLSSAQIQERAESIIGSLINSRQQDILETYDETSPEYRLEEQYNDLAVASAQGRINILLIEDGYFVPGKINENGQYEQDKNNNFLNDLVLNVINTNAEVYVMDEDEMPENTGIAAITRY